MNKEILLQNAKIVNGKALNSCHVHDWVSYSENKQEVWFIDGGLEYVHTNIIPDNKGYEKLVIEDLILTAESTILDCYNKMLISVYHPKYYDEYRQLTIKREQLEKKEFKTKKAEDKRFKDWKAVTEEIKQLPKKYFSWKKICELTKAEITLIREEQSHILDIFPLKKVLLKFREEELNDKNYN